MSLQRTDTGETAKPTPPTLKKSKRLLKTMLFKSADEREKGASQAVQRRTPSARRTNLVFSLISFI